MFSRAGTQEAVVYEVDEYEDSLIWCLGTAI